MIPINEDKSEESCLGVNSLLDMPNFSFRGIIINYLNDLV